MAKFIKRLAVFILPVFITAFIVLSPAVSAATVDEIVAMHDAGIPSDTIIKVIDATGLDRALDIDTIIYLKNKGLDQDVLDYLAGFLASDETTEPIYSEDSSQSNYMGGGFHDRYEAYSQNGYQDYNQYPSNSSGYYGPPGSISIYEPPVYFVGRYPYYGAWQAPHLYGYDPNAINYYYGNYPFFFPPYYNHDGRCDMDDIYRHWYHDRGFRIGYHDDNWNINLHF
jgi:hypothetical protein